MVVVVCQASDLDAATERMGGGSDDGDDDQDGNPDQPPDI